MKRELIPVAAVTVAVFLLVSALRYVLWPRWHAIGRMAKQIAQYRSLVEAESGRDKIGAQIEEKYRLLQKKHEKLTDGLGDPEDVSALLQIIFNKAWQAGVRIEKTQPQPEVREKLYTHYPVIIELTAGYGSLGTLVSSLEKTPHILRIERMAITADARETLKTKMLVTCFLKNER